MLFQLQLVGQVKLAAIEAFNLPLDPEICRLYIDGDADLAHIPRRRKKSSFSKEINDVCLVVYDHQTVDSIEFKENNTDLCLKLGQALKENDILLYILSHREPSPLELVVDRRQTLKQLWTLIKQELRMNDDDNDYHLCEIQSNTTTTDDDGRPLNEFDETLMSNELSNGTQLTIKLGSVPSKNHVRLRIFRIIGKTFKPSQASMTKVFILTMSLQLFHF